MTRRQFLKGACGAAALLPLGASAAASPGPQGSSSETIGVLVDTTRCIGCRSCVRACSQRNNLPQPGRSSTVWEEPAQALTYDRWTAVNLEDGEGTPSGVPVKKQCLHCLDPACVSVCPVGAMRRLPSGAVVYRKERCIGCRYCVFACPFGIPKFQWDSGLEPVVGKCQFCAQHALFTGPACAAACPTGALKFGQREDLLFEARARVHARGDRYVNHIYGEKEAGGTAWLYLAGRPMEKLGFARGVPREDLPALTRWALQAIPVVVTVLAVLLSALAFLLKHPSPKEA